MGSRSDSAVAASVALALSQLLGACAGEGKAAQLSAPPPPATQLVPLLLPPRKALAWTTGGSLALIDGASGAVLARAAREGQSGPRDTAIDEQRGRAIVFEGAEDASWGTLATYGLSASRELGARVEQGYVDGEARVLAVPEGILLFADGPSPRWKVLREDRAPSSGLAMGRPASIVVAPAPDGLHVRALSYGDDAATGPGLLLEGAVVNGSALASLGERALPDGGSEPSSARLVELPGLGAVLVEISGATLSFHRLDAAGGGTDHAALSLAAAPARLEEAAALGASTLVLLTSEPTTLVFAALREEGALLVTASTSLPLAGVASASDRFFSRALAPISPYRLLVATDAGVFAVDVREAPGAIAASLDPAFSGAALRGPVAAVP